MHAETVWIRNFRRLKDARIDLASDISIFVGPNNSGKTSAAHALLLFTASSKDRFSLHDFSSDCWDAINAFGEGAAGAEMPTISIDLWFRVQEADLHRVVDLLPSLAWQGGRVGIRVELGASDATAVTAAFQEARARAREGHAQRAGGGGGQPERAADFDLRPRTLCDYLSDGGGDRLRRNFELRYYLLDSAHFDAELRAVAGYTPTRLMPDKGRSGKDVLASLLKVDFLHAQRHLSDSNSGARSEDLSRCLSRFYERNLEKRGEDYAAQRALSQSETLLNTHLERVFGPTLERLAHLGYPGVNNPRLLIRTALNPATILSSHDGARVHYAVGPEGGADVATLPDRYNGLGFKNLIYMVIELLDAHARWLESDEDRPPIHLVFIEEPEAHLHAQLQQVFIRKVLDILAIPGNERAHCTSQLVVSTHSPHVLFERGFQPIRYFRRTADSAVQRSEVLSLAAFYADANDPNDPTDRTGDFLERYLRLTHCDLFFADAAILVEGNVERLLMPQMITKAAPGLQSTYLSIIEIGGAFGHRFKKLIDYLGLTSLIVTDIDSVLPPAAARQAPPAMAQVPADEDSADAEPDNDEEAESLEAARLGREACMVDELGALTSNQTLVKWLPGFRTIAQLLAASAAQRVQPRSDTDALVRVAYQTPVEVTWRGVTQNRTGRTLEEAFALQNLAWCQDAARKDLGLRVRGCNRMALGELAQRLYGRVKGANFRKTDFALALLAQDPAAWTVPRYISDGLQWLEEEIVPAAGPPAAARAANEGAAL